MQMHIKSLIKVCISARATVGAELYTSNRRNAGSSYLISAFADAPNYYTFKTTIRIEDYAIKYSEGPQMSTFANYSLLHSD